MKRRLPNICILFVLLIFTACYQDVIDVDLSDFDGQLVIEGRITDQLARHTITVNRTSDYSDPYTFPPVSGAELRISDNEGNTYSLYETNPGIYRTDPVLGVPGRVYQLDVRFGGRIYSAQSYMPPPIPLDSIKLFQVADYNSYELVCYFQDEPGREERAMFEIQHNYQPLQKFDVLYNGVYRDGEYIVFDDFDWNFSRGILVTVIVNALDETSYNIYYHMNQSGLISSDDSDVDVGNLLDMTSFNISNFSNHAIGMFSAESVRRYELVVE